MIASRHPCYKVFFLYSLVNKCIPTTTFILCWRKTPSNICFSPKKSKQVSKMCRRICFFLPPCVFIYLWSWQEITHMNMGHRFSTKYRIHIFWRRKEKKKTHTHLEVFNLSQQTTFEFHFRRNRSNFLIS